jgi:5'-deoxynucleotidase YfbR-like HD superfamily hydrolase
MSDRGSERLWRQVEFIAEIDKLKSVERRTTLIDRSRQENSAEHSWHIALMAVLLSEHSRDGVDLLRVVKMLLVHDLVEIDAGDTFCYDAAANEDKEERERAAAERLFALPPADQGAELWALWEEFEARETAEARFATALDRMQPILQNLRSDGASWQVHGIRQHQVLERNRPIEDGSPTLWEHVSRLLDEAVERGILER